MKRSDLLNPAIYEPVAQELGQVREMLRGFSEKLPYPWLSRMLGHVLGDGGKMLRPTLTLLVGKGHGYHPHLHLPMAAAIEVLHTGTLIHDDTIDNSAVRRGRPTLNILWDRSTSVLAGDYLFAQAAELAASTGNLEVIRLFARTLMNICTGELEEGQASRQLEMTREHYFACIAQKTASLFSAAAESGALLSQAPAEAIRRLRDYGHYLGMAFQLQDDLLDFVGDEEEMGKPVGSDLLQGTLTLPSLLLVERYPEDNPVAEIFRNSRPQENLERAIALIRESTILEECQAIAQDFQGRACRELEGMADGSFKKALQYIAEYAVSRRQ